MKMVDSMTMSWSTMSEKITVSPHSMLIKLLSMIREHVNMEATKKIDLGDGGFLLAQSPH